MGTRIDSPLVVDIRRNSLDDGPGIRTVVFFKGCPLRCVWCQNPECISPGAELQAGCATCLDCGACGQVCQAKGRGAGPGRRAEDCQRCGRCVDACPAGARRMAGRAWDLDGLVADLLRDRPFFERSGGGVTLSGGEPFLFPETVGALTGRLRAEGVHLLAETAGLFDFDAVAERILPHLDCIYFDLKLADEGAHRTHTGRSNGRILDNLRRLVARGTPELLARVPLIPGITDDPDNLRGLARILTDCGLDQVALLAYNPLWLDKRRALGLALSYSHQAWMEADQLASCRQIFESAGLTVRA